MSKRKHTAALQHAKRSETYDVPVDNLSLKPDFASWDVETLRKYNKKFKTGPKKSGSSKAELLSGVQKHYSALSESINETETILYFLYATKRRGRLIKASFDACDDIIRSVNSQPPLISTHLQQQ